MLTKIRNVDFVSKEVKYHGLCSCRYQKRAENVQNNNNLRPNSVKSNSKQTSDWHFSRQVYTEAFKIICCFIDSAIIKEKEVHKFNDLNNHYQQILYELGGLKLEDPFSSAHKLEKKIKDFYGDKIIIQKGKTKKGNIIFSSSLSFEEALRQEICLKNDDQVKVRDVAFLLRRSTLNAKRNPLPEHLKLTDILQGEVPKNLRQFLHYLIYGPNKIQAESHHECKQQRIKSISEDIAFSATSGKKTSKQLISGLAMKSLTGFRRFIEILNRLGHTACYHTIEKLETELNFFKQQKVVTVLPLELAFIRNKRQALHLIILTGLWKL